MKFKYYLFCRSLQICFWKMTAIGKNANLHNSSIKICNDLHLQIITDFYLKNCADLMKLQTCADLWTKKFPDAPAPWSLMYFHLEVIWYQIGCNYTYFWCIFIWKVIGHRMGCNYNWFLIYIDWKVIEHRMECNCT